MNFVYKFKYGVGYALYIAYERFKSVKFLIQSLIHYVRCTMYRVQYTIVIIV